MPSYAVTDPNSGKKVTITGDSPPTEADLDEIFSAVHADSGSSAPEQLPTVDAPKDTGVYYGDPALNTNSIPIVQGMQGFDEAKAYDAQQAAQSAANKPPEPSLYDKNLSALKAGGVMLGNIIPATVGALGGSIYGIGSELAGAPSGSGAQYQQKGAELLSPFSTQDPLANEYMQNVGEALSPLAGLPVGGEINALSGLAPAALKQGLSKPARMVEASQAKKADVVNRIASGTGDKDLAALMLDRPADIPAAPAQGQAPATIKARAIKDDYAQQAIKQGFDEGTVAAIKATNPENKAKLLKMAEISEKGKQNSVYGANNRPSDIVGDSLAQRIQYVKKVKSDAGNELDAVAGTLKKQPVDTNAAVDGFISDLDSAGVTLDKNNNPIYKGSDFEGDEKSQKILNIIIGRAKNASATDAYGAHNLKRYIDDKTNYGVSKEGLSGDAERIVKKFRANIDGALDSTFEDYNKANTKYADTITALNDFQKAAGGSVDLFGDNADKALGTVSRRLLSNAQSRVNLMDSIKSVEDVSKKYGAKFDDDIMTQVMFADELDKIFGAHSKTSLLGDVEKGASTGIKNAQRDLGQTTVLGAALQGGAKAYDYLNRVTPERQYKSIKELLARDAKKEAAQ